MQHANMQTALRIAIAWFALGYLIAAAQAGEDTVPVDGFEMLRVCACDCVNQYELQVQRPVDDDVICQGLRDDGEWTDITPSRYTPNESSKLLFHTRDRFSRFACERRSRL